MRIVLQPVPMPLLFLLLPASFAWADGPRQERLIAVSGSATVQVVPDQVVVTVGVTTVNKDIHKALSKTDESVRKLFSIAEQHGVEKRHVRTDYVNIGPEYERRKNSRVWIGHEAKQTVAITLADISKYESLMKALLLGGVSEVHNVSFRTTEIRKHKDRARVLAIEAAREKATAMSGVLDEEIGRVYSIVEEQDATSGYRRWWGSNTNVYSNISAIGESEQSGDQSTVAPGQIAVKAKVSVNFELK